MIPSVIAVDAGNKQIKTSNFCFDSGLACFGKNPPPVQMDTFCMDGFYYALSKQRVMYSRDKTKDSTYYILTLIGIAKELMLTTDDVNITRNVVLAVGLPPMYLRALSEKLKAYYKKDGNPAEFTYEGRSFKITISDVYVFPQGYSAIVTELDRLQADDVCPIAYIIDIGGYTTDVIKLIEGEYVPGVFLSFEMGVIPLINRIGQSIDARFGSNPGEVAIERMLRGNRFPGGEKYAALIDAECRQYTAEILATIADQNIVLEQSLPIFVGGGSEILERYLDSKVTNDPLFVRDIHANATGYVCLAQAILAARQQI